MADGQWYWCLDHHAVEPFEGCRSAERLGPYATAEDAAQAIATSHARNETYDNDPRWNDDTDEDGKLDEDDRRGWNPLGS